MTEFVRQIHDTPTRMVLAATGGGSGAISALLEEPGASRTVLEATVPYSAEALTAWLGCQPEQFCSSRTARAMAMVAYQRARGYAAGVPRDAPLAGVACTASLASDRTKRGEHRAYLAAQTSAFSLSHSLQLVKGHRSRPQEESLVSTLLLNVVAEVCRLPQRLELPLHALERVETTRTEAPDPWQRLLAGQTEAILQGRPEEAADCPGRVIFSGAFNPQHAGHREMARHATRCLGRPVEFEISIFNVDKPPLDFTEMQRRADQFTSAAGAGEQRLWFTRAATFVEKSQIFPGATFVVGADTIERIGNPRYYGDSCQARDDALAKIAGRGCRFLVFGRASDGRFKTLAELALPATLEQICQQVSEEDFRCDISSTQLRSSERS